MDYQTQPLETLSTTGREAHFHKIPRVNWEGYVAGEHFGKQTRVGRKEDGAEKQKRGSDLSNMRREFGPGSLNRKLLVFFRCILHNTSVMEAVLETELSIC